MVMNNTNSIHINRLEAMRCDVSLNARTDEPVMQSTDDDTKTQIYRIVFASNVQSTRVLRGAESPPASNRQHLINICIFGALQFLHMKLIAIA